MAAAAGIELLHGPDWQGSYYPHGGAQVIEKLIRDRKTLPQAIVCAHDLTAIGAIRALAGQAVMIAGQGALGRSSKRLWAEEGLPRLGAREMFRRQDADRWPFFYGFSPAVVPRPPDWREGIEVAGYWWPEHPPRTACGPGSRRCACR